MTIVSPPERDDQRDHAPCDHQCSYLIPRARAHRYDPSLPVLSMDDPDGDAWYCPECAIVIDDAAWFERLRNENPKLARMLERRGHNFDLVAAGKPPVCETCGAPAASVPYREDEDGFHVWCCDRHIEVETASRDGFNEGIEHQKIRQRRPLPLPSTASLLPLPGVKTKRGRRRRVTSASAEREAKIIRHAIRAYKREYHHDPSQSDLVEKRGEMLEIYSKRGIETHLARLRPFGYEWPDSFR